MRILVERITSDSDTTISTIFIDGQFQCFGLEDEYREEKLAKETRIPVGVYDVGVRTWGRAHKKYSTKFGAEHKGMLEVQSVPGFTDILIHIGNTEKDTAGCLLVGYGAFTRLGQMNIQMSNHAYRAFYSKVIEAALNNELKIAYVDRDRS
jgi:hypothetical protein